MPGSGNLGTVLPLVTAFLGYLSAQLSDWFKDRRSYEREQAARVFARQDLKAEKRIEFQRKTLLELQDATMKLMQMVGQLHMFDARKYRDTGSWHPDPYPDSMDEESLLANAQTAMLGVRVADEVVRKHLQNIKDAATAAELSKSFEDSRFHIMVCSQGFVAFNTRVGEVLRSLDDSEKSN